MQIKLTKKSLLNDFNIGDGVLYKLTESYRLTHKLLVRVHDGFVLFFGWYDDNNKKFKADSYREGVYLLTKLEELKYDNISTTANFIEGYPTICSFTTVELDTEFDIIT